jgi:hypothetical protein
VRCRAEVCQIPGEFVIVKIEEMNVEREGPVDDGLTQRRKDAKAFDASLAARLSARFPTTDFWGLIDGAYRGFSSFDYCLAHRSQPAVQTLCVFA